jgi:hypothetical protein
MVYGLGLKCILLSLFFTSLKHHKAVLSLFGSLGAAPSPPTSDAAAPVYQDEKQAAIQGEAEISQQNAEQLLDFLGSASLNEDVATHEGQRVAQQSDSAAAAASCALVAAPAGAAATSSLPTGGPELMSLTAAGDRCCIRKWMEVPKNLFWFRGFVYCFFLLSP